MRIDVQLKVGDRLLVSEHGDSEGGYVCRIVSTAGPDGRPPYRVLRYDTGTEELFDFGADHDVRILTHAPA